MKKVINANIMSKKLHRLSNSYLATILVVALLFGCDYHEDSVYLGRKEAKFLGDVNSGDIEKVKEFLNEGGNVNLQDEPGMTPLHHAANTDWKGSNYEMIKFLINRGADVNAIDDTQHTPLHLSSNATVAGLLIDAGADVNAKTKSDGKTLLFAAAWGAAQGANKSHHMYLDLTKLLLLRGADVNVKLKEGSRIKEEKPYHEKTGDTPLHKVARSYSEKHAIEVSKLLFANGAKLNERNVKEQTPLDEALANGRNKTAEFLRKHGGKSAEE